MTSIQRRGRVYIFLAIGTILAFDFATKLLLLSLGTLRWPHIIGTMFTAVLSWFLWRGSKAAYGFLILCLGLALVYAVVVAPGIPMQLAAILIAVPTTVAACLLAPATRSFSAYRREALASDDSIDQPRLGVLFLRILHVA